MSKICYDTIKNAQGEPLEVTLSAQEQYHADAVQSVLNDMNKRIRNSLGFERLTTTLTTIMKKITEQKFFQIAPADYIPLRVGEGAWSSNLLTYRSFDLFDDGASGIINMGSNSSRLASADAGVDSVSIPVNNWAKSLVWNIIDLEQAAKSGNWDLVSAKEQARKKNFDLFIQKTAFLGVGNAGQIQGLYNQNLNASVGGQIKIDTTTLTNSITSLAGTPSTLSAFIAKVLNVYRANCQRSAWPTHFIIPESDYLGLATPSSPTFPLKSILQLMEETFQTMTGNKNFKILPCAYGDSAYSGSSNQMYVLLNYAEESLRMDLPVDYTNTLANSVDNFSFQNVGYAQFTGVLAYRPLELYYFQFPASNLS